VWANFFSQIANPQIFWCILQLKFCKFFMCASPLIVNPLFFMTNRQAADPQISRACPSANRKSSW
jgi:hypothetical protein